MADTPQYLTVPTTRQPSLNASIKRVVLPALISLISLQSTVWDLPQKRQEEIARDVNDAFTEREQTTLFVVYCQFGHEEDHEGTFQDFALTWPGGSKIFEEASQSFSAFRGSMLNEASVTGKEVGDLWKDILEKIPSLVQQSLCLYKLQWMDKSCLSPDVYVLRKENHAKAIALVPDGTEETLILGYDADFPKLVLTVKPHKRILCREGHLCHDEHVVWRDDEDEGNEEVIDAGAFTISQPVDDSALEEYLTHLCGLPITEGPEALQYARRLDNGSKTFFLIFWLVANGKGAYDRHGRKLPPYGVSVKIEERTAEFMNCTEQKMLKALRPGVELDDTLNAYQCALQEMRRGYRKWEDRGKSDVSMDYLWNNPDPKDLSAAIGAIDKRLEEISSLATSLKEMSLGRWGKG
ncbi:MAG: hypothetical protein M1839_004176 [Geoglossum umbratile]|nr:MAG: hypothetical protein M1839_004176 [Geoglossum umbratile]